MLNLLQLSLRVLFKIFCRISAHGNMRRETGKFAVINHYNLDLHCLKFMYL